jgi:hypothetical protein
MIWQIALGILIGQLASTIVLSAVGAVMTVRARRAQEKQMSDAVDRIGAQYGLEREGRTDLEFFNAIRARSTHGADFDPRRVVAGGQA